MVRAALLVVVAAACAAVAFTFAGRGAQDAPAPSPAGPVDVRAPTVAPDAVDVALGAARALLAKGDEPGTIVALDEIARGLPEADAERRAAVQCELATVLNNRAARIFKDDARTADVDARRALALCPGNEALVQNRARLLLARAAGEDRARSEARARARGWLEESLALREADADAHVMLGEILFADDDVAQAAVHLRRAVELRPDDERLARRLEDVEKKASVEGAFRDNRRQHFVARFEGFAQEQLSWTALDHLEKAYFVVGAKLGIYPAEPITVVIYTGDQYRQVSNVPDWAAGSFDGKIRIREGALQLQRGQLEALLRHEYTHAVVATLTTRVPTWMNEGLAQHFEGEDAAGMRAFLARAKADGALLPYEAMQAPFVGLQERAQAQVAYALATVMVRALVDKRGEYALQTLMSRLTAGEPFEGAFVATYATTPRALYDAVVADL